MAEAFLRAYAADQFEAHSAGLEPRPIHPLAVRVMQELGLSLREHRSKDVKEYMGTHLFAYLIIVCANAEKNCPTVFPGVIERLFWDFEDPAAFEGTDEEKLAKFRELRDRIHRKLRSWLARHRIDLQPLQ
jgi:arsenate reductase